MGFGIIIVSNQVHVLYFNIFVTAYGVFLELGLCLAFAFISISFFVPVEESDTIFYCMDVNK